MKILAVHKGFACDHSSTSYEFLAVDRPLDVKAKAEVSSLSSRACPTDRRVSFIYHAEGYDIPGGWEALMRDHYDVMYSESYDWWTFAMAFDAPKAEQEALGQYEFAGVDELGVSIGCDDSRVTVTVSCRIDSSVLYALTEDEYEGHGYDYDEDYDDEDEDFAESGNGLLDLLSQVREQLIAGDYRALYAVWETYGWEAEEGLSEDASEEPGPPRPPHAEHGQEVVQQFQDLLAAE